MHVQSALICDSANVREGLLSVLSGGLTRLYRRAVPAPMGVSLALMLDISQEEAEEPHQVSVTVLDPHGVKAAQVMGGLQKQFKDSRIETGEHYLAPVVVPLQPITLPLYGRYHLEIRIDEGEIVSLAFYVLHPDEQKLPTLT